MTPEELAAFADDLSLAEGLSRSIAGSRGGWSPHTLHPKQRGFMALDAREVLYGGAAGGGKTDALLAAALQYMDRPQYSALILRRTYPALKLRGAIMDRAREWLSGTDAVWKEQDKRWTAPSGATLQFGYCDNEGDLERYKGPHFHFIAIDELTEWPEGWYGFLFSRLRKHVDDPIPLRMRAGTNPDGIGAEWVRQRFAIPEGEIISAPIVTQEGSRVFFPARAEDNPTLDLVEYEKSLVAMTGSTTSPRYQQLRWGRWLRDFEGLVYAYDPARNLAELELPAGKEARERAGWHFMLGIDYGFRDSTAFAVLGWRDHDATVYVLESMKRTELTPSDAADITHDLEKAYGFERIVGDVGGLGKGYAEETRRRFHIPVQPAEKKNKRGYIDLLNGDLRSARLRVVAGRNDDLVQEWTVLPWDEERKMPAAGFDDHIADAVLYVWRAANAWLEEPAEKKPAPGTREALEREAEEMFESRVRLAQQAAGVSKEWWDL